MWEEFIRMEMLIGTEAMLKLQNSKIAIFGIGGVGTYVAEGLIRSGVEHFVLIDDDVISRSNINRQLHATSKTIGQSKVHVMKQRMQEINPRAEVEVHSAFVLYDNIEGLVSADLTYLVDALDTITAKIAIAFEGKRKNIPVISSMGTGNKLNPAELMVSDIYETSVCPLCKVMRKELKKRGLPSLKVVYSKEVPIKPLFQTEEVGIHAKRAVPGSTSFVPSSAGLLLASEVVKDIIGHPFS